jgi:2-phosphosulfolactate phosphatase
VKIRVAVVPAEIQAPAFKGKTAVVIDVLRATTSIVHAMSEGAEKIIPVATIETATRLAASLDRRTRLLCGERDGERVDGFDLGNSPGEYTSEAVAGKTLILTTTNGTDAMARLEGAREVVVCAFANVSAAAQHVRGEAELLVACAGDAGAFSLEDAVCAGHLVARLRDLEDGDFDLNDGAAACESLYAVHRDAVADCLRASSHGRRLVGLGFGDDIEIAARIDSHAAVPVIREGRIV